MGGGRDTKRGVVYIMREKRWTYGARAAAAASAVAGAGALAGGAVAKGFSRQPCFLLRHVQRGDGDGIVW